MSNTLIHRHFEQHELVRPSSSASAIMVEDHVVDLDVQTYIETRMDEIIGASAMGLTTSSVAPLYVDTVNIGAADPTTGIRQVTVENSTGVGKCHIRIFGRFEGEARS